MFGDQLKRLREEKKIKQDELSSIIGVSRQTISNYELNEREPDLKTIELLADFFNVSIDFLIGRSNVRNPYVFTTLNNSSLNNHKHEIENILDETQYMLQGGTDLTLAGEPASPEAVQSVIDGIKFGLEQAKKRNKKKQD